MLVETQVRKGWGRDFSTYLDLVRLALALFVVAVHSNQRWLIASKLPLWDGMDAVIAFFVLSGYVITHASATTERGLADYAAARISRIYSLSLLAVLSTPVLDSIGRQRWPSIYIGSPSDHPLIRMMISAVFLGQSWAMDMMTFSNGPYWSLNFEAWYYVAFGLYAYLTGSVRLLSLVALSIILGPKLLLLAPCWLMGVWLYRTSTFDNLSPFTATLLCATSLVLISTFRALGARQVCTIEIQHLIGPSLSASLSWAKAFPADYCLGAFVAMHLGSIKRLTADSNLVGPKGSRLMRLAGIATFPIYIFHYPFLLFWGATLHGVIDGVAYYTLTVALTIGSSLFLGAIGSAVRPVIRESANTLLRIRVRDIA